MPTTSNNFTAELSFRLGQRLSTAAQLAPFLNFALNKIEGLGSYEWDLVPATPTPTAATGALLLPSNCHIGKWIGFNHPTDTTPIRRVIKPEAWVTTVPAGTTRYDSWFCAYGLGTSGGTAYFSPGLNPGVTLNMLYHRIPTALDGTAATQVPWEAPDVDNILLLVAECEAKRVLNFVGWQDLVALTDKLLAETVARYSSSREMPGIIEWASRPTEKT